MNHVDQLFSEKLGGHSTTPSAGAWAKVEAGLSTGTNSLAWMRWAAVLIPAIAAASFLYNRSSETPALVAVQSPAPTTTQPVAVEPVKTAVPEPVVKTAVASKKVARKKSVVPAVPTPLPEPEVVTILPETVALEDITIEPTEPVLSTAEVTEAQQPIVLVYTLESTVTNAPEDKPTSLERVVEFARTVKHSDPIGDLRGWKDELLAMDLRKKSTKRN